MNTYSYINEVEKHQIHNTTMDNTLKFFTAVAKDDFNTFKQMLDEKMVRNSVVMTRDIGIAIGYELKLSNCGYLLTNNNHSNFVEVASRFGSIIILKYVFDNNIHDELCYMRSCRGEYYKNYTRPISIATKSNQIDTVKYLIDKIPITPKDERKLLKNSIRAGYIDMAKIYLNRKKININSVMGIDIPLICYCCDSNQINMLNMLLSYGADANISVEHTEGDAITPLKDCIDMGNLEGIKIMAKYGLDVNRICGKEVNGLWYAIMKSELDIFEFILVNCKPNLEMKDRNGNTILQKMILDGNDLSKQIVQLLLKQRASLDSTNNEGISIKDILESNMEMKVFVEKCLESQKKSSLLNSIITYFI